MTLNNLVARAQRRINSDEFIAPIDQEQLDDWTARPTEKHHVFLVYAITPSETLGNYFRKEQIDLRPACISLRAYDLELTGKQLIELAVLPEVSRIIYHK